MILQVLRVILRGTTEYYGVLRLVLRDTTRFKEVPFVPFLRDIISSFFMTLSNASKLAVVQYHRKTPTVESFLIKFSAWGCNFNKKRTLSQLFFREFHKIFKNDFFERRSLGVLLKKHTLYIRPLVIPQWFAVQLVLPCSTS